MTPKEEMLKDAKDLLHTAESLLMYVQQNRWNELEAAVVEIALKAENLSDASLELEEGEEPYDQSRFGKSS